MTSFMQLLSRRWEDALNLVLGVWLLLSPQLFSYFGETTAAWNAYVLGAVIGIMALAALTAFKEWEEWISAALGAWLIASPWVLGFTAVTTAFYNAVAVGFLVAAFALWSAIVAYREHHHHHRPV